MAKKKPVIKVEAERMEAPAPPTIRPEDIKAFVTDHPVLSIGIAILGLILMKSSAPRPAHLVVPELGGRRNSAWRGKGSFGHAPFGKQSSHR